MKALNEFNNIVRNTISGGYKETYSALLPENFSILTDRNPRFEVSAIKPLEEFLLEKHIRYSKIEGVYKGEKEIAFLVGSAAQGDIETIGKAYGQESVIHYDGNSDVCTLQYVNGPNSPKWETGQGYTVYKNEPKHLESYSKLFPGAWLVLNIN